MLSTYIHPLFLDALILFVAVAGTYEMSKAVSNVMSPAVLAIDMVSVGLGFAAFWFAQYFFKMYSIGLAAYMIVLVVMVIITFIVTGASKRYVTGNAISTVLVMMYPCALLMFTMGFNYFISPDAGMYGAMGAGSTPFRNAAITLIFTVPTFTDMMAYAVGSRLKGKKLCPSISPNKTVSGAIGGLVGGLLASGLILLCTFLAVHFDVNICGLAMITDEWWSTIVLMLVLGLVGSVFDQAGDLVASYIKRKAGIKDFSNLLPGHGGVLDRMDGFMFCGVFFYLFFSVLILAV